MVEKGVVNRPKVVAVPLTKLHFFGISHIKVVMLPGTKWAVIANEPKLVATRRL